MTKTLLGLQFWAPESMNEIVIEAADRIAGVILGDPFCHFRMFANGKWDLLRLAESAKDAGKRVVYQTPVYLTHPRFDEVLADIDYFEQRGLVDMIFAQDVGLLAKLKEDGSHASVVWSCWGITRTGSISYDLVNFLISHGISGMEVDRAELIQPLKDLGLQVLLRSMAPTVLTFTHRCYLEFFHKAHCDRGNLCRKPPLEITDRQDGTCMIVNGYVIESAVLPPFVRSPLTPDWSTVYLRHSNQLSQLLSETDSHE